MKHHPGGVPTFWFAVHRERGPFDQLAAALRRRGYRVVRLVVTPPSPRARRVERILYDRVVRLDDLVAGRDGPRPEEHTIDLQWSETMSQEVPDAALDRFPAGLAARLRARRDLSNKRYVADRLAAHGIPVAAHLSATEVSDAEAAARLGLPLVVKSDIGAAASGVRFARTEAEIAVAVSDLDATRASVFFQPLLPAEVRNYGGVIAEDGTPLEDLVVRQHGQVAGHRPGREVVDDPELLAYGRRLCAALGVSGPVDLEAIRDDTGRPLLIDLNARAWGSMMSMRRVGPAFDAHYLAALGVTAPAAVSRAAAGDRFEVFPDEVELLVGQGRRAAAVGRLAVRLPRLVRWLGLRYPVHLVALRLLWRAEGAPGAVGLPTTLPARDH